MSKASRHIGVIGGGLVGSMIAIYLRRRGYEVTVLERRSDIRKTSMAGGRSINLALSSRGILSLDELGLSDVIKRIAIPMHGRMIHDVTGRITFQPYGKEGQYINSVSRSDLNIILLDEAEKSGVRFLFDHRCINIDLQKNVITCVSGDQSTALNFDIVIGADGAFSEVRHAMQFTDRFNLSQYYIEHGYKELHIPASESGSFQLEQHALHIWPRESFMMIALPNPDSTFTCTLFLPFEGAPSFSSLNSDDAVMKFFEVTFPDALAIMPTLVNDFNRNSTSSLVTVKCFPWVKNRTLLIGDAAHAVVPFYGQGMNAGFEDCRILNKLLDEKGDRWEDVLDVFQRQRKPDADAIAELALDNFIEMRDHVADDNFLIQKRIEARLHELYPDRWIPQYSMVTFRPDIRYSDAQAIGKKQKAVMDRIMKDYDGKHDWETLDFEGIVSQLGEPGE